MKTKGRKYHRVYPHHVPGVMEVHAAVGAYIKDQLARDNVSVRALADRLGCEPWVLRHYTLTYELSLEQFWPLATKPEMYNLLKELAQ